MVYKMTHHTGKRDVNTLHSRILPLKLFKKRR